MENKMLQYKVKQISWIGKAFLVVALMCFSGNFLFAQGHNHGHGHEHEGGTRTVTANFNLDLSDGDIQFTDASVTVNGAPVVDRTTEDPDGTKIYRIYQSGGTTQNSIWVGTPVTYSAASNAHNPDTHEVAGTPVTKDTRILLDNIDIDITSPTDALEKIPIMVNNATGSTVFLILKESSTNNVAIDISASGNNHNNNHAAIEKELSSDDGYGGNDAGGSLVITCETGYHNYNPATYTGGHNCSASGTCGKLNAYANLAKNNNCHGSAGAGGGAAAIGSIGSSITGASSETGFNVRGGMYYPNASPGSQYTYYRYLKNLVIAGGVILAKGATNHTGPAVQYGGAGIGTGCGPLALYGESGESPIGPKIENLCITGGYIVTHGGTASAANLGGGYRSGHMEINIKGGYIDAKTRWQEGYQYDVYQPAYGQYDQRDKAAGIGAGSGGRLSGSVGHATVNISGGEVWAQSRWGAAIGGGSGGIGVNNMYGYTFSSGATVNISCADPINNPTVIHATTLGSGAAIGSGGLFADGEYTGDTGDATITITGSRSSVEVRASSTGGSDIGTGGQINTRNYCDAGKAIVNIYGGTIYANSGGIGGGHAVGGKGGEAEVTIKGDAWVQASSIGGGRSQTNTGGKATVTIDKIGETAPTIDVSGGLTGVSGTIGGGDCTSTSGAGDGGTATVIIKGGSLSNAAVGGGDTHAANKAGGNAIIRMSGGSFTGSEIGGGNAYHTSGGTGGNAFIVITGGSLDCRSIGGGDADYGTPGDVADPDLDGIPANDSAGIYIEHATNIISLKTGYIGGGSGAGGAIGKATAYIDAPNATIQGQFILSGTSTNHSYFTMKNGKISNEGLSAYGAVDPAYPRKYAQGGAVYMDDTGGTVTIGNTTGSGNPTIQNCTGTLGGAIYMSGGTFTMNRGTIGGTAANTNINQATNSGGALYMAGGNFTMKGGSIQYNKAANTTDHNCDGGGVHIASGIATINGGNITGNTAERNGGGLFVNPGSNTTTIESTDAAITISGNEAVLGGGAYIASGTVNVEKSGSNNITFSSNTASNSGGGIYAAKIGSTATTVTLKNVILDGNKAHTSSNTGQDGGGVYVASGGSFTLDGGTVQNNIADNNGGGFYVDPGSITTYIKNLNGNVTINSNQAKLGAGAYVASGDLDINGTTSGKTFEMSSNQASVSGGGAYVQGGTINVNKATLNANKANGGNGGGIYVSGDATVTGASMLSNNEASSSGGGIYVASGSATVNGGSTLSGNQAKDGSGGGIYAAGTTTASGSSTFDGNTAKVSGGGIYVASGTATVTSCILTNNTATTGNGGGVYAAGNTTVTTSNLSGNHATVGDGGGVYVASGGELAVHGSTVSTNGAGHYGGGFFVDPDGSAKATTTTTVIDSDGGETLISGNTADYGAGAYVKSGDLEITKVDDNAISITSNEADYSGGGVYVAGGQVTVTSAIINSNQAKGSGDADGGGGIYAEAGQVILSSATVKANQATSGDGGGVYAVGAVTATTSTIGGATADDGNTAGRNGGGVYAEAGANTILIQTNSIVKYNSAVNGGGIYAKSGDVTVNAGSIVQNNSASNNGGGLYATGGTVTLNNTADNTLEIMKENDAQNGGAVYAAGGTVNFSDGQITNNSASAFGGALYIAETGKLTLKGTATLSGNHVPANGRGGGVYLLGVVEVGSENPDFDPDTYNPANPSTHPEAAMPDVIKVNRNYHGDGPYAYPANSDNVFLPNPRVDASHKDVITVFPFGMNIEETEVGFYVTHNLVPVIYCSNEQYLHSAFSTLVTKVFDDRNTYQPIHELDNDYYDKNHIYLSGGIWFDMVRGDPGVAGGFKVIDGNVHISSPDALAWLISYVDGRGADEEDPELYPEVSAHPDCNVYLDADLTMSSRIWTPIGDPLHSLGAAKFTGKFYGQGHTINGIITAADVSHGFFGTVENGTIQDVFLADVEMPCGDNTSTPLQMGGIVQRLTGNSKVLRCGVGGTLSGPDASGMVIGGIAAVVSGTSIIEDCYFSGEIEGYTMGGLVGQLNSGCSITNSFAYAKYTTPSSSTANCGGLVAVNAGTVTNCYAHAASASNLDYGHFGWLAGSNTGTFSYCYVPVGSKPYIYGTAYRPANCGRFGATELVNNKYGFAHCDQQITKSEEIISGSDASAFNTYVSQSNGPLSIVDDKTSAQRGELHGLLTILNKWAGDNSGHLTWTRTMASPINDDYPLHVNPSFNSVGSPDGLQFAYGDADDLILKYNGETTSFSYIYVYSQPGTLTRSTNTGANGVRLYIPENMGIKQSDGVTTNARVGVTFDNSKSDPSLWGEAYAWHMFSSALADAPLGVVYNPNGDPYTPAYGAKPPVTGWYQSDDPTVTATYDPAKVGYFPTDTPYGYPHTSDAEGSFDLYCYYEPYAHWINFKRNSNDHWHTMDHYNIHYTNEEGVSGNEDHFIKGKGYLAAISKTSMLMAEGTLNNGDVQIKTSYTDPGYYYGHDLKGVNLIGNPYQSYLDFNVFAATNSATLRTNAYYILDADKGGYVGYVPGASSDFAPQFLHPHQGFLVLVNDGANQLTFTNGMRKIESEATGGADPYFRGEHIAYPLVSMTCTDSDGMNDFAIVELGRPETGGGEKLKGMHSGDASIWFHFDETDWYTAFTTPGINEAPLRFRAYEDGVFTLTWHPENAEFSYLHLIDNITGSDVDCLATDKYVFEGRVTDYTSRFRLKFDYSEENGSGTESETFAFMMGNELVVNGEGVLQVFDVMGRQIMGMEMQSIQSTVTLPDVANGVYVLRLTTGNLTKTQKLVINK